MPASFIVFFTVYKNRRRMRRACLIGWVILGEIFLSLSSRAATETSGPKDIPAKSELGAKGLFEQDHFFGFEKLDEKRSDWGDNGILFNASYAAETFGNPMGGIKQSAIYAGQLDLELTLDFKKMAGWDGSFHASANYTMGNSLTDAATNDLLQVSSLYSYNTLQLFELWYEQRFLDDKLSLRVGQMGADSEFFISSHANLFLNSTFGWPVIIDSDAPTPSSPYGAPGLRLRADPEEHWIFLAAVFAGDPAPDRLGDSNPDHVSGHNFDNSGTAFNINGNDGAFAISELAYKLNQEKDSHGLPGTFKFGGWVHTGGFGNRRYDDHDLPLADPASDGHPQKVDGNFGFYVVTDQAVWQEKGDEGKDREIGLFFRAGNAENDRSKFNYYFDGGIVFSGLIPSRPDDSFGVATAYGHVSSSVRGFVADENTFNGTDDPLPDAEQNIEATYCAQIAPWWTIQPDIQFIIHPGGSSAISNALVLGCRTTIIF